MVSGASVNFVFQCFCIFLFTEQGQSADCFVNVNNVPSYSGTIDVTTTGRTCQRWDAITPHTPNYPMGSEHANYCRAPDNDNTLWCYTMDPGKRWEYCNVPECADTTTATTTPTTTTSTTTTLSTTSTTTTTSTISTTSTSTTTLSTIDSPSTPTTTTPSTPTSITSQPSTLPTDGICMCLCNDRLTRWSTYYYGNLTQEEKDVIIQIEKERIKKELTLDKKELSSYIRAKTSAEDERPSAKSTGYLGIALLTLVCGLFILIDFTKCVSFCMNNHSAENVQ